MQPCCEEYRKIWPTDYQGYKLVDLQWDRELGEVTESLARVVAVAVAGRVESFLLKPTSRSKQRRDGRNGFAGDETTSKLLPYSKWDAGDGFSRISKD